MKKCVNCGKEFADDAAFCDGCGCALNSVAASAPYPPVNISNGIAPNPNAVMLEVQTMEKKKKIKRKYNIFAIILAILFFIAGTVVWVGASSMADIRSVAGDSIMEASYQGMGIVYEGMGIAMYAIGAFLTLAVHWMGKFRAEYFEK